MEKVVSRGWARRLTLITNVLLLAGVAPSACSSGDSGEPAADKPPADPFRAASTGPVEVTTENGDVRTIRGTFDGAGPTATPEQNAAAFIGRFASELGLTDPSVELAQPVVLATDAAGSAVVFERITGSIPVFGSQIRVHVDPLGRIRFVSSTVTSGLSVPSTTPGLDEEAATAAALAAFGGAADVASTSLAVLDLKLLTGQPSPAKLAYRVELVSGAELPVLWLDANDGSRLFGYSAVESARTLTYTALGGTVMAEVFGTTKDSDGVLLGRDCGQLACTGYDQGAACCGENDLWIDGDTEVSADVDDQGRAAHAHLRSAVDWFETLGQTGWDGKGGDLHGFVHFGPSTYPNAFWTKTFKVIAFGDDFVSADVATHEFTHAVNTGSPWPLLGFNEPGALNEGIADIFAALKEDNWEIVGTSGKVLRDLDEDALRSGIADTRQSLKHLPSGEEPSEGNDNGHVHFNSGLVSRTAQLMAQGKTHWVTGVKVRQVSKAKLAQIYLRALRLYLLPASSIASARSQIAEACTSLIGWPGLGVDIEYEDCGAVINAFAAVNVGEVDTDVDTWIDSIDNCPKDFNPEQGDADDDGTGDACEGPGTGDAGSDAKADAPTGALTFYGKVSDSDYVTAGCPTENDVTCLQGLPNARVQLFDAGLGFIDEIVTDDAGAYTISGNWPPGDYRYSVQLAGYSLFQALFPITAGKTLYVGNVPMAALNDACQSDDVFELTYGSVGRSIAGHAIGEPTATDPNRSRTYQRESSVICLTGSTTAPTIDWNASWVAAAGIPIRDITVRRNGALEVYVLQNQAGITPPVVYGQTSGGTVTSAQPTPPLEPGTEYTISMLGRVQLTFVTP